MEGFNKKGLCKLCKEPRTKYGHDPCIANLPGVLFACCGHGQEDGYIKFTDGRYMSFTLVEMELGIPQAKVIRPPVPLRVSGEWYSVLDFKARKKRTKQGKYNLDDITFGDS